MTFSVVTQSGMLSFRSEKHMRREVRNQRKAVAERARQERQYLRRMKRDVMKNVSPYGIVTDDNLRVLSYRGLTDPLSLRQAQNVVARMIEDFRRHNAVEEAGRKFAQKPQPVRPKKTRPAPEPLNAVALPKTFTTQCPLEVANEEEVGVLVPSSLRHVGGTLDGSPVGEDPKGDFRLVENECSTLVAADEAACGEIAKVAEEKTPEEPVKPVVVNEHGDESEGEKGNERTISSEPGASGSDAALWEEIEALENRVKHWQAECEAARTALFEANERTRRVEEAFLSKANGTQSDEGSHVLARLLVNPNARVTLSEALSTASSLYPEKMIVLPSAYESAEKLDDISTRGGRLLKLLIKLGSEYYEALAGKGDSEARHVFSPSEYSACESETVRWGGLGRLREFSYNGTQIRMEQHLKIGVAADTSKTLRCYFAWLAEERRLVIGYCGEHLPVSGRRE